jgi:hypothetical protein
MLQVATKCIIVLHLDCIGISISAHAVKHRDAVGGEAGLDIAEFSGD